MLIGCHEPPDALIAVQDRNNRRPHSNKTAPGKRPYSTSIEAKSLSPNGFGLFPPIRPNAKIWRAAAYTGCGSLTSLSAGFG